MRKDQEPSFLCLVFHFPFYFVLLSNQREATAENLSYIYENKESYGMGMFSIMGRRYGLS